MSKLFDALQDVPRPNVVAMRHGGHLVPELARLIERRTLGGLTSVTVTANPREDSRLVSLEQSSPSGEKFRVLADRVAHAHTANVLKIFVVTSATAGEGKSFVASNLAITLAKDCKKKTLLLEGDFANPVLAAMFGVMVDSGVDKILSDSAARDSKVYFLENIGLHLLPVAESTDRSFSLLQSPALGRLLQCVRNSFDCIVIDSPSLEAVADAGAWCRVADGVLLVVRERKTARKAIQSGLDGVGRLLGVVMNEAGAAQCFGNQS